MPGELKDPEQSVPFYYDPKYDQAPSTFEPGASNIDGYLQSIVGETLGIRLSPEKLDLLKEALNDKGFFHRNPGDEMFRSEVTQQAKRLMMARRIARKCLI